VGAFVCDEFLASLSLASTTTVSELARARFVQTVRSRSNARKMVAMDSASIADAVDHAAAMLAQAASEVYVADEEYYPMADVKWLARIALFWAQLPWLKIAFAFATLVAVVGAYVATHRDALVARFDSFVTNKVLSKMQARLAGAVSLGKVRVRPFSGTVIVEEFTLGNPPTAEFNAPYLVSMQRVHVKCNPLSMAGVRGKGNFVVGYLYGEVKLMSVKGATVYVDEVPDPKAESLLGGKKIRNFQNIKRQTAAQAAAEREREEAALALAVEEKRIAEEAMAALAAKDPNKASSLFDAIGDSFSTARGEIDKQLAEVNKQAAALGSSVSNGIQAAGQDVTNRLNALVTLLERVNQKPPEETEDEKRKKRKLTLELDKLHFEDWNIHILAVTDRPFKFKSWELENFKGVVGALARQCASGLLNEIIVDFQNEILNSLTKDIAAVGDGLLNVGGSVVGVVGDGGAALAGGIASGAETIGKGLSDTGGAVAKGFTDTGEAIGKGLSDTTSAVTGFFGLKSTAAEEEKTVSTTETTSVSETTTTTTVVAETTVASAAAIGAGAAAAKAAEARAAESKRAAEEAEARRLREAKEREAELAAKAEAEAAAAAAVREAEEKELARAKARREAEAKAAAEAIAAAEREMERAAAKAAKEAEAARAKEERERVAAELRAAKEEEARRKAEADAAAAAAAAIRKAEQERAAAIAAERERKAAAERAEAARADAARRAAERDAARARAKEEAEEKARAAAEKAAAEKRKARERELAEKIAAAEAAIEARKRQKEAAEAALEEKRRAARAAKAKEEAAAKAWEASEAKARAARRAKMVTASMRKVNADASRGASSAGPSASPSSTPPESPRADPAEPYSVRVKYLARVFDVVDVDGEGKIKVKTFIKALERVEKIGQLLEKGANVVEEGARRELTARTHAALEKDKNRVVTKEEFIRYFLWER
jgi:hypothetical protein